MVNGNTITVDELIEAFTSTLSPVYPFELETAEEKAVDVSLTDLTPSKEISVLVPVFPGTVGEYDVEKVFNKYDAKVTTFIYQDNPEAFAEAIANTDIVVFADGGVNGDVPSIGAYGLYVLNQTSVKAAVEKHLADSKQVLGFGNGFQILVKSGLIPFEKVGESTMSFKENVKGGRISLDLEVVAQKDNKWTANNASEVLYQSNTYGALVGFINEDNVVYKYSKVNPSGSLMNIEALQSNNGNVFGRFGEITDTIVKNALNGVSHE